MVAWRIYPPRTIGAVRGGVRTGVSIGLSAGGSRSIFRDLHAAFKRAKTTVLGISKDSCERHAKFRAKEKFPFELLSDEDEKVCRLFDVIREKTLYGRKFMGIERSTFLFDGAGKLAREWRKLRVKGHAAEVLEAAKSL